MQDEGIVSTGQELREHGKPPKAIDQREVLSPGRRNNSDGEVVDVVQCGIETATVGLLVFAHMLACCLVLVSTPMVDGMWFGCQRYSLLLGSRVSKNWHCPSQIRSICFGNHCPPIASCPHPNGLLLKGENAITNGSFSDILDKSIPDWPLVEAEELAQMALKCSRLRCRERPNLETEVLPLLKKLTDIADANLRVGRHSIHAPSHYFCPILQ
ncbi:hypothetical protein U1Q18_025403, partial [Sarracenia purpurea var. burkii]